MDYRIANTFTDSLARIIGEEQKAVKMTVFDLRINPAHSSMSFHKPDKTEDQNLSPVQVSRDI